MRFSFKTGKWLGILIAFLSYSYIIYRLLEYRNKVSLSIFSSIEVSDWLLIISIQITLLSINLYLESKKWQVLLKSVKQVSLRESFKMVLAGFASGIFTPAKIGEPVGRVLFLQKEIWAKSSLLNYIGGAIHNLVIGLAGLIGLIASWSLLSNNYVLNKGTIIIFLFCLVLPVSLWYKRSWIKAKLLKYGYFGNTLIKLWKFSKSIPKRYVFSAFMLSLARFIVYCLQIAILLVFMGANVEIILLGLVPVYFLLITLIPSFFLADLGIRGSVALYVFSYLGLSDMYVVVIVSFLWLINQVIPAMIGSVLILNKKQK